MLGDAYVEKMRKVWSEIEGGDISLVKAYLKSVQNVLCSIDLQSEEGIRQNSLIFRGSILT
jgi:hypothetical protein